MFSEILKIIPKLDTKDLQDMERSLNTRLQKVAKKFGSGLASVLKGGGIAGLALGFIDKLLNPLKETQEAIDRILKTSDDLATNANQFNTTTGKLFKLVTLAKATGLDQDNLFMLINKYQTAVAQARANPNDPSVSGVKNFTSQKDTVEGFYGFIQSLQKMTKDQQVLIQSQIFGEKQILKMADFLQQGSEGFAKLAKQTGIDKVSTGAASSAVERSANLADLNDALTAGREFKDVIKKSGVITEGMIRARDKAEKLALERETQRIKSYEDLQTLSNTTALIMTKVEEGVAMLGGLIAKLTPFIDRMTLAVEKFMKSPIVSGMKSWFGGSKE